MIMLWWTTRCFWSSFIPLTVTESEIFLRLNSVGLQSFRFGPEIAYVASCVLDALKGVRNKTLVGGAKKGKYNTFILEIIKISRVICMINTPSEPKRQVVLARMFILLPLISIINFNLGLIIKLIGVALLPSFAGLGNFRHLLNRSQWILMLFIIRFVGSVLGEQSGQLCVITRCNFTLFNEAANVCCANNNKKVGFVGVRRKWYFCFCFHEFVYHRTRAAPCFRTVWHEQG